jgi:hypothetical protein
VLYLSLIGLDHLASRGRHIEASQVYLDYADDVDAAVDVVCRGAEFGEAYRIVSRVTHRDPFLTGTGHVARPNRLGRIYNTSRPRRSPGSTDRGVR